jgi:hypothetical protein
MKKAAVCAILAALLLGCSTGRKEDTGFVPIPKESKQEEPSKVETSETRASVFYDEPFIGRSWMNSREYLLSDVESHFGKPDAISSREVENRNAKGLHSKILQYSYGALEISWYVADDRLITGMRKFKKDILKFKYGITIGMDHAKLREIFPQPIEDSGSRTSYDAIGGFGLVIFNFKASKLDSIELVANFN